MPYLVQKATGLDNPAHLTMLQGSPYTRCGIKNIMLAGA